MNLKPLTRTLKLRKCSYGGGKAPSRLQFDCQGRLLRSVPAELDNLVFRVQDSRMSQAEDCDEYSVSTLNPNPKSLNPKP